MDEAVVQWTAAATTATTAVPITRDVGAARDEPCHDRRAVKIVSPFKDYYDSMRAMDREPDPLYLRDTRTLDVERGWWARRPHQNPAMHDRRNAVDPLWTTTTIPQHPQLAGTGRGVVGFCGRLYPFLTSGRVVCWTLPHFIAAVTAAADDAEDRRVRDERRQWLDRYERNDRLHEFSARAWDHFMASRTRVVDDAPFRFFDAPVLVVTDEHVVVNPQLRFYNFATQVDVYTAWQDLSTFLGNNLVKNVDVPRPVSDRLKAEAHGFDQQSFRKAKRARAKVDRGDW